MRRLLEQNKKWDKEERKVQVEKKRGDWEKTEREKKSMNSGERDRGGRYPGLCAEALISVSLLVNIVCGFNHWMLL